MVKDIKSYKVLNTWSSQLKFDTTKKEYFLLKKSEGNLIVMLIEESNCFK